MKNKKLILLLLIVIITSFTSGWIAHGVPKTIGKGYVFDTQIPVFTADQVRLLKKYYPLTNSALDNPWMFYPSKIEETPNHGVLVVMSYLKLLQNGLDPKSGAESITLDGEYSLYFDSTGVLLRRVSSN